MWKRLETPDGWIETADVLGHRVDVAVTGGGNPPGVRGVQTNCSAVWWRLDLGQWKRSGARSYTETKRSAPEFVLELVSWGILGEPNAENLPVDVGCISETFYQVIKERYRQASLWGVEDLDVCPGGSGEEACRALGVPTVQEAKDLCGSAKEAGSLTWGHVLVEEVCEILEAGVGRGAFSADYKEEVVQTAAVLCAMLENRRARISRGES